ncbi:MAG TPA: c-type cytochrome domain-containing protein [Gemmataceae bacterium]|nr:c-type cytochrome domain-containing protein [Gemmataceae bacterium]
MRYLLTLAVMSFVPLTASAQVKEVGPLKEVKVDLKGKMISYDEHIEPILAKRCTVCHSGSIKEGRLDVGTYETLMKGGKSGEAVKPGKSQDSILYKAVMRTVKRPMPPKGEEPCTAEEAALIKLWIDGGAKAPSGVKPAPKIFVSVPPPSVKVVRALAFNPDKSAIAVGRSNQIHIYDAGSGAYIRSLYSPGLKTHDGKDVKAAHLSIVESMAWSPDGKWLVSGSFQEVTIWDALTGEQRHKITGFAHSVVAIAFSLDGKKLGVAGGAPTIDGEVKVFDVPTWKMIFDLKNGHSDTVYGLAFSPEMDLPEPGQKQPDPKDKNAKLKTFKAFLLATCSADKFVKVWNLADGKMVKSFEGHTHHVLDVGWQADGKLLASAGGDNTVKVWDWEKGEQARTINAHGKQVTRLLFVGKKTDFVTCGGDNAVKRFNTNGGNTGNFAGGTDFIYAIAVSPDGALIAAGGQEGTVRIYNGTNTQLLRTLVAPGEQPPMKETKKK